MHVPVCRAKPLTTRSRAVPGPRLWGPTLAGLLLGICGLLVFQTEAGPRSATTVGTGTAWTALNAVTMNSCGQPAGICEVDFSANDTYAPAIRLMDGPQSLPPPTDHQDRVCLNTVGNTQPLVAGNRHCPRILPGALPSIRALASPAGRARCTAARSGKAFLGPAPQPNPNNATAQPQSPRTPHTSSVASDCQPSRQPAQSPAALQLQTASLTSVGNWNTSFEKCLRQASGFLMHDLRTAGSSGVGGLGGSPSPGIISLP